MKVLKEGTKFGIEKTCTGEGNGGGGCRALLFVEADDIGHTSRSDMITSTHSNAVVVECLQTFLKVSCRLG